MNTPQELIESGLLEVYVLGDAAPEEIVLIEEMAAKFPEVKSEITQIELVMERLAMENTVAPDVDVRAFVFAIIDLTERLTAGEVLKPVPFLSEKSKISDYKEWLDRPDLQFTPPLEDLQARIIGHTPQTLTAIVWVEDTTPEEVHTNELESFLIIEGTCAITIDETVHQLVPGDFLTIPLFKNHQVKVTSATPCKVILQRTAA